MLEKLRSCGCKLVAADSRLWSLRVATAAPLLILAAFTSRTVDNLANIFNNSWAHFLSDALGNAGAAWFVAAIQVVLALGLLLGATNRKVDLVASAGLVLYGVVALVLYPVAKATGNGPFFLKDVWWVGVGLVLFQHARGCNCKYGLPTLVLRLGVVFIFAAFSMGKWNLAGADGLVNAYIAGTWLEFLPKLITAKGFSIYLGVFETAAFLGLLLGLKWPKFGVVGAVLVAITGLVTVSLLPQLPYMPFIVKDLVLLGAGFYLASYDAKRACPKLQACQLADSADSAK